MDATLRDELDAALAGEPDRTLRLSRMVESAVQHGYVVTAEALSEFALISDDTDRLSGDQRSQVAGGIGVSAVPPRPSPPVASNCGGVDCGCVYEPPSLKS
jgi:hypothetical protein